MTTHAPTAPPHRLLYIRHGETEWSRAGRHTGASDIALTAEGRSQAQALAPVLQSLALVEPQVWSSPRERAARTAELAGLRVTRTVDELAEWDYGDYEGRTSAEIRRTDPGWSVWDHPVPGGENLSQVAARADAVIADALTAMAGGDVVLVAHGHLGRVLAARFLGAAPEFGRHLTLLPASVAVYGFDHDAVAQIRQFGRTGYESTGYSGR